jgi:mono/diheme cytochrome c family protein
MTLTKTIAFAGFFAVLAGAASAAPAPGDPARGKQLYFDHGCYGCHGYSGQTGARNLVGTNSPIIANPQAFLFFLRQRGNFLPMIPSTAMPRFSERALPDAQAMDIYAYIKTFKLDAPEVKTIPVMGRIEASAAKPYKPAK